MTDADEFEAFVRRYEDMVFATAVRLLGNPTEAEDVAQTVFLRALEPVSVAGRQSLCGRMAEDRDDEPVPEPPVAIPEPVALFR